MTGQQKKSIFLFERFQRYYDGPTQLWMHFEKIIFTKCSTKICHTKLQIGIRKSVEKNIAAEEGYDSGRLL